MGKGLSAPLAAHQGLIDHHFIKLLPPYCTNVSSIISTDYGYLMLEHVMLVRS